MQPTAEVMAQVPLARSYLELFRVTGPLLSLVLRAEDVWQRYNQYIEVCGTLNQGFPFSPLQCRQGRTRMPVNEGASSYRHNHDHKASYIILRYILYIIYL